MVTCNSLISKYNLNKENIKKWLLANHPDKKDHPDKNHSVTIDEYNTIIECYRENKINKTFKNEIKKENKNTKKNRAKIFSCMRKTANFGKILNHHKFDKQSFNQKQFLDDLEEASPKIIQLMKNIEILDALDQKNHGKKFKHFIFSDVKEGGYGAKILASAFMAAGFHNVVKARKIPKVTKLKLYIDSKDGTDKNFGLLSSNAIYGSTFNEKVKKELLTLFNSRPNNIYGKKIRFIIFDSGFKEGIDLFDVKYVHIFEPSMTIADLKQTVGRATRTCGQKGLEFQHGKGWPLYVYNYYLTVPDITTNTFASSKFLTYNITDTKNDEKDEDILIFRDIEKLNDATMLYSEFDKAMNNLSKQLFELAPQFAVDYSLTKNMHNIEDLNTQFMEKDFYLTGGAKDVFKKINKKSKYYKIDFVNCKGKCGNRSSNDVPISLDFMKRVYKKYKHPNKNIPKNNQRKALCEYMSLNQDYCRQLNYEWSLRYAYIPEIVEKKTQKTIKNKLDDLDLNGGIEEPIDVNYDLVDYEGKKESSVKTLHTNPMIPNTKLSFIAMRNFIKTKYNSKDYIWESLSIENKCIPKPGEKPPAAHEIELNPTQKFITNYFCPQSPYKGMLLWHSVGTGKTCTGVATASMSFEKEGYSILWVTRTTLKSDVWKNIFDQICHAVLKEEVKLGLTLPEKLNERKKFLSKNWLEPISYKQFSNLLLGKNKNYEILKQRNGASDVLKKTLIIIDEAHKLYGGDLKAIERPDTNVMENLIMNSYKKSGKDSCKLLLMTATPFTNSPMELFSLVNLFVTNESEKITTDKDEFKKQFMTSANILSENGVKNLANKLSGYISYLNREKDPTQFAQPIMINVPVLMNYIDDENIRQVIYLKKQLAKVDQSVLEQIKILKNKIKELKKKFKEKKAQANEYKKTKKNKPEIDAVDEEVEKLKELIDKFEEELEEANTNKNTMNDTTKLMKEKLRTIKKSLIQEYILFTKCKNFKYIESGTHKVTKKMLKLVSNKSFSNSLDSSYVSSNKTSLSETYNPKIKTKKPQTKKY
jgi:hypothetical protein